MSAFHQWSFHDLKPQVIFTDSLSADNVLKATLIENHYQDIRQANITSATIRLQTLDSLMRWLSK